MATTSLPRLSPKGDWLCDCQFATHTQYQGCHNTASRQCVECDTWLCAGCDASQWDAWLDFPLCAKCYREITGRNPSYDK